jgi:hypothetical protein
MRKNITAFVALVLFASTSAFGSFTMLDFTGWDHSLISNGGQTFDDICGDIDVTVTSIGMFDGPSSGNALGFSSFHTDPGAHSFRLVFSAPLDLMIETLTVDPNEVQSIFTTANETYVNNSGAPATVTPTGTGIAITGNGFGINPTGAAFGTTTLDAPVTTVTLTYQALSTPPNKYGQWRIFADKPVVPEPNAIALMGVGALGMLLQLRKRRNS